MPERPNILSKRPHHLKSPPYRYDPDPTPSGSSPLNLSTKTTLDENDPDDVTLDLSVRRKEPSSPVESESAVSTGSQMEPMDFSKKTLDRVVDDTSPMNLVPLARNTVTQPSTGIVIPLTIPGCPAGILPSVMVPVMMPAQDVLPEGNSSEVMTSLSSDVPSSSGMSNLAGSSRSEVNSPASVAPPPPVNDMDLPDDSQESK